MKQRALKSWSLMLKVPLTIILVVIGVAATIGVVIVTQDRARFRETLENEALMLTRAIAATAAEAAMRRDHWALYQQLRSLTMRTPVGEQRDIVLTGMILDPNGVVMAHLQPADNPLGMPLNVAGPEEERMLGEALRMTDEGLLEGSIGGEEFIEAAVPMLADGKSLGIVRVRVSTAELRERTQRAALLVLAVTLGLATVGSLFGGIISRRMVRPLDELARGMEALGQMDPAEIEPIRILDRDEIGQLTDTFNRVAQELAEKKRLEEKLALSEKLAGLGRIAAGVAHEVNNPLAGMLNCINTLRKRPDDRELLHRYLDALETGLNRIARTVQGLLVDLRSESMPSPCGVSCMADLRVLIKSEIGDRPIRLDWQNELEEGFCVDCTCPEIQQILLNLAMNAIDAMPEGGSLTVRFHRRVDRLLIDVSDTGVGIPDHVRRRMFDPFYTGRSNGTGLGLWITYRLVERMGGAIEIDSQPGVGSRFRVNLPIESQRTGGTAMPLEEAV